MRETYSYTAQEYKEHHVGLHYPDDIEAALLDIANNNPNGLSWVTDNPTPEEKKNSAAYFLGYSLLTEFWENPSPSKPFSGVEKLNLPDYLKQESVNVIRFGCASEFSHIFERDALSDLGVHIRSHWTIDISSIPLKRIAIARLRTTAIQSDAQHLPFMSDSFDIATTDRLLGKMPRKTEVAILNDVRRILHDKGIVIMKIQGGVSGPPPSYDIGTTWRDYAIDKYGVDADKKDNYLGLTEEQWKILGQKFNNFVERTWNNKNMFNNLGEIKILFRESGLLINQSLLYPRDGNNVREIDDDNAKGSFIIMASKV